MPVARKRGFAMLLRDPYARPLMQAVLLQFGLVFFSAMILDGGVCLQACCYSSAAFWLGTLLLLIRRPRSPTRGDLAFIRWALPAVVAVGVPAFLWVWQLKRVI
jgi:hypothetical protein